MQLYVAWLMTGDQRWLGFATHSAVAKSKPKVTSVVVYKHGGQLGGPDVKQVASRTLCE